jgi:peptidoglycan/LPS O-acetylase OafA/YrhL
MVISHDDSVDRKVGTIGVTRVQRVVQLDAVRGVAIALVILHHVWYRFPNLHGGLVSRFFATIGWAGVDLFFGISGFLITTILMRSSGPGSIRSFFVKRAFRILPIYLIALSAFALVSALNGVDRDVLHRIWINAGLLTAWFIPFLGESGVPFTITWSVSVEEFAYVLLGCLVLFGTGFLKKSLPWLVLGALVLRAVSIGAFMLEPVSMYYFAPGRIDAIAMGGIMAKLPRNAPILSWPRPWILWLTWFLVVGACSSIGREAVSVAVFGYTVVAIVSAWLVLRVSVESGPRPSLVTRAFASLGLVSYFVYLFHEFVIGAAFTFLPARLTAVLGFWALTGCVVLLTYALGMVSWRLFELPLIELGREIAARKSSSRMFRLW